jgi:HEPN domain-containing protein
MRDSEEELFSAEILLANSRYRAACFHSQQCVEKCLKALILEKGEMPEKTHDILELLSHTDRMGWKTGLSLDEAVFLNSIYKGRYPSEEGLLPHGEPTEHDARRACESARRSLEASRQSLS